MNFLGDELLADPGLSQEEHRCIGRRYPLDEGQHLLDRGTLPDELGRSRRTARVFPEVAVLVLQTRAQLLVLGKGVAELLAPGAELPVRVPALQHPGYHVRHGAESI